MISPWGQGGEVRGKESSISSVFWGQSTSQAGRPTKEVESREISQDTPLGGGTSPPSGGRRKQRGERLTGGLFLSNPLLLNEPTNSQTDGENQEKKKVEVGATGTKKGDGGLQPLRGGRGGEE